MIQRVFLEDPMNKRPLGMPRLRWEDGIRKDFLNVIEKYSQQDWREVAENKKEWKRIFTSSRWSQRP